MNYQNKQLSLGEGNTPLIRLYQLEKYFSWQGELWAKCEYQNPTGSFKDRGSIVEISEAIRLQKNGIVCASTGNMAASLAAYAARACLPCFVFVPAETPTSKLRQALIAGAKIVKVDGVYDDCVEKAENFAIQKNLLLCGDYDIRRLGQATIGEELARSKINFDAFVVPVGNGTLGCGIAQAFSKFNKLPRFIGVQGSGADPIYQAWEKTNETSRLRSKNNFLIEPIKNPKTVASAMNVGKPLDGKLTLELVNKTDGVLYSVSDLEIVNAQSLLARIEGMFVETASASTVAILSKIQNKSQKLVLILSGNGLKEL